MTTIMVEFDGKAFVPDRPVSLPVGTRVAVALPESEAATQTSGSNSAPDDREWQEILCQLQAADPEPGTLEDAMREIRMRP
ncbi:MAG TPA: hypothetical protein VGI40_07185 [Pirellulaceae bacterium]|jgi:hypothetical protein